ncbi:hypothetical protein H6F77_22125 [Microcoleus sp. FACHB-831]|nr:hypothetical protein [Microcoleus sp. FACHB-831]MBD1923741.1 hypothetical protein [Microcoleus sp. FACHB-831]
MSCERLGLAKSDRYGYGWRSHILPNFPQLSAKALTFRPVDRYQQIEDT